LKTFQSSAVEQHVKRRYLSAGDVTSFSFVDTYRRLGRTCSVHVHVPSESQFERRVSDFEYRNFDSGEERDNEKQCLAMFPVCPIRKKSLHSDFFFNILLFFKRKYKSVVQLRSYAFI